MPSSFTIKGLTIMYSGSADSFVHINEQFSCGGCIIRCTEKKSVYIGKDNQYSNEIRIWTGDGHAIFNNSDECINHGGNIYIGDHVWIGHGVEILKNTSINDHSVIGAMSLVSGQFKEKNIILAGNPAKIIKRHIKWDRNSPHKFN